MARRVTLREIGKKTGVSSVAVGAALGLLSPKSKVKVGEAKAEEIRRVAHEMGFLPNNLARAFHRQETKTVGVLFRVLSNPSMVNFMLDEIHRNLGASGYNVNLRPYAGSLANLKTIVEDLVAWRVDGLAILNLYQTDGPAQEWEAMQATLNRLKVPFVTIESSVAMAEKGLGFTTDLGAGFAAMTGHLLGLGHRNIATLGDEQFYLGARWRAIQGAVAGKRGARATAYSMPAVTGGHPVHSLVLSVAKVVPEILKQSPRPTAIISGNDYVASAVVHELIKHGLSVPGDVSVTGYDNSEVSLMCSPELTTMSWPAKEIAQAAVETLLKRIKEPAPSPGPGPGPRTVCEDRRFEPTLVVRGSTGRAKSID